jgi:hypothetical protein
MKTWVLIIACVIGSLFAYGRYNGAQAKKHREQKSHVLVNKQIEEYWPQAQGAKVVTYPKQVPTKPVNKSNIDNICQSVALKVGNLYEQLESALTVGYKIVCSTINNLEIKTAKTSKSPFIDLFPEPVKIVDKSIEKKPAVKRPRPSANEKIVRKRPEQPTRSSSVITRTVPLQIAEMPRTIPLEITETSVPVPIVNSNNEIEIHSINATPAVPRANFDYVVVNYNR